MSTLQVSAVVTAIGGMAYHHVGWFVVAYALLIVHAIIVAFAVGD